MVSINSNNNNVSWQNNVPNKGNTQSPQGTNPGGGNKGLNNGPDQDTFSPNNNLFSGALDKTNAGNAGGTGAPPAQGGDAAAVAAGGHQHPNLVVTDPNKYRGLVDSALQKQGLDPKKYDNIILAMIWQESKGDPKAVGADGQGSKGLMQVTAANQKGGDHFDPATSINAGVEHFAQDLKTQGGDLGKALAAYNQGDGGKNSPAAQKYATQIQNKAKFFEQGKTPAGQPDPTSPGFTEPKLGGPSGEGGTVSGDTSGTTGPDGGDQKDPTNGSTGADPNKPTGNDTPAGGETDPNKPSGNDTPTGGGQSPAGGSGSEYVDNMMKAFDKLNAPQELKDAYMDQYKKLGLIGGDGKAPAGPDGTTSGGNTDPTKQDPTKQDPTGGVNPPPSETSNDPTQNTNTDPASGADSKNKPGQTGKMATSAGNNAGSPADAPPESAVFTNASKVNWDKAPAPLKALQKDIQNASQKTGVPESIIAGTIWQESGGNINVSSTDGGSDSGLMQIDNTTYDKLIAGKNGLPHGTTPTDPAQNIMAGATYLKQLKDGPTAGLPDGGGFGTWDLALRAYNSGEYSGVNFADPDALGPAGRGDAGYLKSIRDHVKNLEAGTPPQNR